MGKHSLHCAKCFYKHRKSYKGGITKKSGYRAYCSALYKDRHPERTHAHIVINNLVKLGKIKHGRCEWGGCEDDGVQFHHPDYSKPAYVIDLCKKHHIQIHLIGGDLSQISSIRTEYNDYQQSGDFS